MKQAVTELCRGMGVEISEQDSEKLRKDAFHPGRDTNTERAAQDTKKTYLLSPHKYRLERYPLQGPNLNRDEWCVKDIQEWAAAVICSWSRSCDCHLPLSPTTTSPSLLTPSFKQAMGTPYLWAHRTGADPRKGTNLYQMTSGHQAGPAPALGTMSITTICPSLVYTTHSSRVLLLYLP